VAALCVLPSFPTRRSSDLSPVLAVPFSSVARRYPVRPAVAAESRMVARIEHDGRIDHLVRQGLEELRRKLLDLTNRNPLLSFKRSEEHTSELQSRENLVCR